MKQTLILLGLVLPLVGCATELHVIKPIAPLRASIATAEAAGGGGVFGFLKRILGLAPPPRAPAPTIITAVQAAARPASQGVWLARSVYDSKGVFVKVRTLRSIEILFCPMKKADFSSCRQGLGWSSASNALALEYPPEPPRIPAPSEPAQLPQPLSTPAPAPSPEAAAPKEPVAVQAAPAALSAPPAAAAAPQASAAPATTAEDDSEGAKKRRARKKRR